MELDFLEKKPETTLPGKVPLPGIVGVSKQMTTGETFVNVQHDPKEANIEIVCPLPLDLPYIQRGIQFAKDLGYEVGLTVKEVLLARANGKQVVTVREADIIYRRRIFQNYGDQFMQKALSVFTAYITEEDARFTQGVFKARNRYNKGVEWYQQSRPKCDAAKQAAGDARLRSIESELSWLGFPIHEEERFAGFHHEFLKPEYMTLMQYIQKIAILDGARTLEEKELFCEREEALKAYLLERQQQSAMTGA